MERTKAYHIQAIDLLRQLKEVSSSRDLDTSWSKMSSQEKEQLASVLFEEGKQLILQGQDFAFGVFDLVRRINPQNAAMYFKQGVFLFDYGVHKSGEKYLLQAQKQMSESVRLDPKNIDAWILFGDLLVHLGLINHQVNYFHEANEKYVKANELSQQDPKSTKKYMWDWALCSYHLGRHSGEAVDIKNAIDRFEKAAKLGSIQENFWRDFGNAYVEMGLLISDTRFLEKALRCFQKSIELKPSYTSGWLSSAYAFQKLYQITWKEDYMSQAHAAYAKAADLDGEQKELWLSWGQLFLLSGKTNDDVKHLQMSIVKFKKALEINPQYIKAQAFLSEAYLELGDLTANLEYLKKGEKALEQVLSIHPNHPEYIMGDAYCSYMFGQYFDDSSYYLMALEKYQRALSLTPNSYRAYYGLGLTEFALGGVHNDEENYMLANQYFQKAANCCKSDPELWNQWGMVHLRLTELLNDPENIRLAVEKFERAITLYGQQTTPALLLFNYACSLDLLGSYSDDPQDYEKSIQVFKKLIKEYPSYECIYYNLALVQAHLGDLLSEVDPYSQALENFYLATQDDGEDGFIWNAWGLTLMQYALLIQDPLKIEFFNMLLNEAEKKLRQAMALGTEESLYNMACLYSLKNSPKEALHYLQVSRDKGVLPETDCLMFDPFLESVRRFEPFHEFIQSKPLKERFEDN